MQSERMKFTHLQSSTLDQCDSAQSHPGSLILAVLMAIARFGSRCAAGPAQRKQADSRPILIAQPDANAQMKMHEQTAKQQNLDAANAERKKQIADDSAKLLKLATDLKTEVDKTDKDTLSLNVIRKADEIERLAHNVKEKTKLTRGIELTKVSVTAPAGSL